MTERSPIPDCLSHLRQLLPKRTTRDDETIKGLRHMRDFGYVEGLYGEDAVTEGADRLEELLPDG
jgi:hypothetical protein